MSDDDLTPRMLEPVPVILARMEGKLDRVQDRVSELIPRVEKIEDRTKVLEDVTLSLTKDAAAEEAKKKALALALKEADDARRTQSERSWTPMNRFMAVLATVATVVSVGIYFYSTFHH